MQIDLVVLYEHPEWQKPLFDALTQRGIRFEPYDLKLAAFDVDQVPRARLYFNQAGYNEAGRFALPSHAAIEVLNLSAWAEIDVVWNRYVRAARGRSRATTSCRTTASATTITRTARCGDTSTSRSYVSTPFCDDAAHN